MPQICPSHSHQLAAAALAFRRARRKFPTNSGSSACSGDAARTNLRVCPVIPKDGASGVSNILSEPTKRYNSTGRRNHASYPSLSSSRTAVWSKDGRRDSGGQLISNLNSVTRPEVVCAACSKRHSSCSQAKNYGIDDIPKDQEQGTRVGDLADSSKTSTAMSRRICSRIKPVESKESNQSHVETASKSTHSSAGPKKRKQYARHRRPCIYAGRIRRSASRSPPKIQGPLQICHIHGYPGATRRRSSIPREPRSTKYYDRMASIVRTSRPRELPDKVYCSDSPTADDFPTKLQTWEHRTQQGCYWREDNTSRREMLYRQVLDHQKSCPKDQLSNLSRNRPALCKLHSHQNETSKKPQELDLNADVCIRPSLVKEAQQKVYSKVRKAGKNYGICGRLSKHSDAKSTWDENLNVIHHRDSMSLLMERFRGNDKHHSRKLQNIYELNSVLGSKTRCGEGEGEPLQSGKIQQVTDSATNQSLLQTFDDTESIETDFPPKKSYSGVNPVAKLGRVANQAIRENESHFKNLRSRLNRSGTCCSSNETPWRRAF